MLSLNVNTQNPYTIFIGEQILSPQLCQILSQCDYEKLVIISDDRVANVYAQDLMQDLSKQDYSVDLITFPHGESSKSREVKAEIEDSLFRLKANRKTCLIALGGGVVCDLVGFVAATYMRGIDVIYCPTTLLSMIDASIGGKTGINTAYGKNTLGVFAQPRCVIIEVSTLKTLSDLDYRFAFSEMIKHALIIDSKLYELLESHYQRLLEREYHMVIQCIWLNCEIKAGIVERDERENGERESLNRGHTVAHAIETLSEYKIPHGLAVGWGLIMEMQYGVDKGFIDLFSFERMQKCLNRFIPEVSNPPPYTLNELIPIMKGDKKNRESQIRFIFSKNQFAVFDAV